MLVVPPAGIALPIVKTLGECGDFSKTVTPFIDQLYNLPSTLLAARSLTDLTGIYADTNSIISGFAFSLLLAQIVLVVSEINRNYSQVDRLWSILPTFYNAHFWLWARVNGIPSQKLDMLLAFSCIWSTRLTFNYWRKGGYEVGSEDYRWEILKKYVNKPIWTIFNVVFISLIQSILLFTIATPAYILLLASRITGPAATAEDKLFAGILVGLVITEFLADNQQWNYHAHKKEYQKSAKVPAGATRVELDRGFNTRGLWQYSRHPNFAAEQAVWVTVYQWSCFETYSLMNWTFAGALSYLLLFQGSTWLTERITAGKYPEYSAYQERVGRFVPKLTGEGWAAYAAKQEQGKVETKKAK